MKLFSSQRAYERGESYYFNFQYYDFSTFTSGTFTQLTSGWEPVGKVSLVRDPPSALFSCSTLLGDHFRAWKHAPSDAWFLGSVFVAQARHYHHTSIVHRRRSTYWRAKWWKAKVYCIRFVVSPVSLFVV